MTHPTPDPEPPPPPPAPFGDIFAVAASLGFGDLQSPVRRSDRSDGGHPLAGGPVIPPVVVTGKEPTPGSAVARRNAARESTGVVAGAGASSGRGGKGVVERAPRPVMPNTRVPLVFGEGRDRLVGRVGTAPTPHPTGPLDPPIPHPPPPCGCWFCREPNP